MKPALRSFLGALLCLAPSFALVVAVEMLSAVAHPVEADFNGNIPEHVRHYPRWVLRVGVLARGATAALATWVATRVGNRFAGVFVALLLAAAPVEDGLAGIQPAGPALQRCRPGAATWVFRPRACP